MDQHDPRELLQDGLGYRFRDPGLLQLALTHRSYANEVRGAAPDNERLEFLGDAVIEYYVSEQLYNRLPRSPEGMMTQARASLVYEPALAALARGLGVGAALLLGRGEQKTGGRDKESLLSNAVEALVGAVLIDGGMEACRPVLDRLFGGGLDRLEDRRDAIGPDAKTELQEFLAGMGHAVPRYEVLGESGPAHRKTFTLGVIHQEQVLAIGSGHTKKVAAQRAAGAALLHLRRMDEP